MNRLADDLLVGAVAIGEFIGYDTRRTMHVLQSGQIPAFKIGQIWHAKRSTLTAFIDELDTRAVKVKAA